MEAPVFRSMSDMPSSSRIFCEYPVASSSDCQRSMLCPNSQDGLSTKDPKEVLAGINPCRPRHHLQNKGPLSTIILT